MVEVHQVESITFSIKTGDSDVGDIVMLVTDLRCWWQNHYVGDFLNVLNRSTTSQTCRQHIWSPTSVTNIDVTKSFVFHKFDMSYDINI